LLADERQETAAAFWIRANAWFTASGVAVRKVLTDNGSCYRSSIFAEALGAVEHRRTRPNRPQTNGKVERFHRTMAAEWPISPPRSRLTRRPTTRHPHYRWRPRSPCHGPQRYTASPLPEGTAMPAHGHCLIGWFEQPDTRHHGGFARRVTFSRAVGDTATRAANTAGAGSADPSDCRSRHADRRRGAGRG